MSGMCVYIYLFKMNSTLCYIQMQKFSRMSYFFLIPGKEQTVQAQHWYWYTTTTYVLSSNPRKTQEPLLHQSTNHQSC